MSQDFNVNEYWLKRGTTYINEERMKQEFFRLQEHFLFDVLRRADLPLAKVLELGCGYGRVTKLLAENLPNVQITALDLSPDQLQNARHYTTGCQNIIFAPYDFYAGAPFPGNNYDAAIAIEVFLHHPAPLVRSLLEKLVGISKWLINLDWSEHWEFALPQHVWIHDYRDFYTALGLKCSVFDIPQKIEGKQQKLFIAGKDLPKVLIDLEAELHHACPSPGTSSEGPIDPSRPELWLQQLHRAQQEIVQHILENQSIILVDDNQWGDPLALRGRRIVPFLEKNGQYWGPPPDDETAIRELQRLTAGGVSYIVFAWPSFWWLEHYTAFKSYVMKYPCVLKNERLVIYQLNPGK